MQSIDWSILPVEPAWDCSCSILTRARRCFWDDSQAFLQLEQQFQPIIMGQDVWSKGVWFKWVEIQVKVILLKDYIYTITCGFKDWK